MNVLLINTNRQKYLAPLPIGLAYIANTLKNNGHHLELLDLMFSENPIKDIEKTINRFKPDIIGYSIRNLDNQYMVKVENQLEEIREFVSISNKYNITSLLGGTAFTTFPELMLDFMNANFGICGQGENSMPLFIHQFQSKQNYDSIPGLVWRKNNTIKKIHFSLMVITAKLQTGRY